MIFEVKQTATLQLILDKSRIQVGHRAININATYFSLPHSVHNSIKTRKSFLPLSGIENFFRKTKLDRALTYISLWPNMTIRNSVVTFLINRAKNQQKMSVSFLWYLPLDNFGPHMAPDKNICSNVQFCLVGIQSQKTSSIVDARISVLVHQALVYDDVLEYIALLLCVSLSCLRQ